MSVEEFFIKYPIVKILLLLIGIILLVKVFDALHWTAAALQLVIIPVLFMGALGLLSKEVVFQAKSLTCLKKEQSSDEPVI